MPVPGAVFSEGEQVIGDKGTAGKLVVPSFPVEVGYGEAERRRKGRKT